VAYVGIIVGAMRVIMALVGVVISFNKLADSVMPFWLDQCELECDLRDLRSPQAMDRLLCFDADCCGRVLPLDNGNKAYKSMLLV
jgi:hypothetical protein